MKIFDLKYFTIVMYTAFIFLYMPTYLSNVNLYPLPRYTLDILLLVLLVLVYLKKGITIKFSNPIYIWLAYYLGLNTVYFMTSDSGLDELQYYIISITTVFQILYIKLFFDLDDDNLGLARKTMVWLAFIVIASLALDYVSHGIFFTFFDAPLPKASDYGRAEAFYMNANVAGGAMVIFLIFTIDLVRKSRRVPYIFMLFLGLFFTMSRSNIMIFLLFLAIMFFQKRIKARHISFLFAGIFLLFTWLSLGGLTTLSDEFGFRVTDEMKSRVNFFSDTKKTDTSDMDERKVVLFAALDMFGDKPIVGNGIGTTRTWNHRVGPHNTFAANWAEFGLFGMLIIPLLFLTATWQLFKFGSVRQRQLAVLVLMYFTFSSFFSHDMLEQPFQIAILVAMASIGEKLKNRFGEQKIQKESLILGDIEGIQKERLETIRAEEKKEKEKEKKKKRKKAKKPKGVKPDDLTKLAGIGKVYQEHLNFEGIFTYEDVSKITVWQTAILKEEHKVKGDLNKAISHAKEIIAQRGIVDS